MAVAGYPTFPCPACGGALPATFAAGMAIACPLCQQRIVVPAGGGPTREQAQAYQAWHAANAHTVAATLDGGVFPRAAAPVVVEAGGAIVVGPHVDAAGRWHVRGVDPATRQVRWEALHGAPWRVTPEARSICARDGRIYVAHEGLFAAIDGAGRALWTARLDGRIAIDVDGAPLAGDETDVRVVGGAVIAVTEGKVASAFARDTGVPLWQRAITGHPQTDGTHLLLPSGFRELDLVEPLTGRTIARSPTTDAVLVAGGLVVNPDRDDRDGVALLDAATGQERWYVAAESVSLKEGVAAIGDEVLVPVNGNAGTELLPIGAAGGARKGLFARLFGGGPTTRRLPWPKHNLSAMWTCGDALVVDVMSWEGVRRVAVLDPRTLAVRHDTGAIPTGVAPGVRIGPGIVAVAFGESNGPKTLRAIDAAGRLLWERTFADLDDVAFRAGHLALRTDGGPIELLDPATGQTRITFA